MRKPNKEVWENLQKGNKVSTDFFDQNKLQEKIILKIASAEIIRSRRSNFVSHYGNAEDWLTPHCFTNYIFLLDLCPVCHKI